MWELFKTFNFKAAKLKLLFLRYLVQLETPKLCNEMKNYFSDFLQSLIIMKSWKDASF